MKRMFEEAQRVRRFEIRLSRLESVKLSDLAKRKGVSRADLVRMLINAEHETIRARERIT